jgi:SAM-dependent methyltransferase
MPTKPSRLTEEVMAELDGLLADHQQDWWDSFYENRAKPCPFFGELPDESLATWVFEGQVRPGRALDVGCGNGRNAVFLAGRGFSVEAVDYSQTAIDWATQRAAQAGVDVRLLRRSAFDLDLSSGGYDLVYDSGCFHHIAPHRRDRYVELVTEALAPGGWFGLTCFRPEGGSGYSDDEVYERRSLGGGLGYTEERLREIWSRGLEVHSIRRMAKPGAESGLFGEPFLWSLLARKSRASQS